MLRPIGPIRLALDIAVPALLLAVFVVPYAFGAEGPGMLVPLVGMCAALAFWRLSPPISLLLAWATAVVQMALELPPDPANLAVLVVLFSTAAYGGTALRWLGLASAIVGGAVVAFYLVVLPSWGTPSLVVDQVPLALQTFLAGGALFTLAWTLGLLVRVGISARESRAARVSAERDVVIEQERNRIARDMHDVVAHSLAVVIAQADGARYARAADDAAVDGALTAISTTAREALADVRLLLTQLRHREGDGPQPVLGDLDRLFDQLRASGLDLEFRSRGDARTATTAVQLAAYRVVQEALTNALRHGTGSASVELDWRPDRLAIVVRNPVRSTVPTGRGAARTALPPAGHGLLGMRERASLVGGELSADAVDAEFVVEALLPIEGEGER